MLAENVTAVEMSGDGHKACIYPEHTRRPSISRVEAACCSVDTDNEWPPAVLVVDDDPDRRVILRMWLKHWGLRVREAGNATQALEEMFVKPANIIFCDIMMPGHDGLWLVNDLVLRTR